MEPHQPLTETRNPLTVDIDTLRTEEILERLYSEEARAVSAAAAASSRVALAVEAAHARLRTGGRVHYFGAGASGRLAVLDATEITPTFGVAPDLFTAHYPGGTAALTNPGLDFEDSGAMGEEDASWLRGEDVAVGITASGSTSYVAGALRKAREVGALCVLLTSNTESPLLELCDLPIVADTGAEALTGSTRLKAGTAAKVILNSFSTALMIRSGKTYSNLMVGLVATNAKLRARSVDVLAEASGESRARCEKVLDEAGGEVQPALVSLLSGVPVAQAHGLVAAHGSVRGAVSALDAS